MAGAHQIENSRAGFQVEIAGRLVGEKNLRIRQQGPRNGDPLLFAAGKLIREVSTSRFQSELCQKLSRHLQRRPLPDSSDPPRHRNVFCGCELRKQMMKLKDKAYVAIPEFCQIVVRYARYFGAVHMNCA